jgi:hypothetical protein
MKRVIIGVLAITALAGTAQAQTTVVRGEDKTVFKKVTVVDFGDVPIDGAIEKPQMDWWKSRHTAKFASMIKLRANFKPELADSIKHL